MRAAVVGCGEMGYAHVKGYLNNGAQIAAVCDVDGEKARELAKVAGCKAYEDLETMLAEEKPDALSICTPPFDHVTALEKAARHHCAILCEKPFVSQKDEMARACEAIRRNDRYFQIGFKFRYEALYRVAREKIGAIGRVQYVLISHFQPVAPRIWKMKEGIVKELLVHACDMACCLFDGFPQALSLDAESLLTQFEGDDRALLRLHFGAGRRAVIVGGYMDGFSRDPKRLAKNDIAFQVVGENGYYAALRNGDATLCTPEGVQTFHPSEEITAFDYELRAFLDGAAGLPSDGPSLRDALASQLILENAYAVRNQPGYHAIAVPQELEPIIRRQREAEQ